MNDSQDGYAYDWEVVRTGKHSSVLTKYGDREIAESSKGYECPRGHRFKTTNPIIIAVDDDPNYNSGPICSYCYVDWFKLNLNATEET